MRCVMFVNITLACGVVSFGPPAPTCRGNHPYVRACRWHTPCMGVAHKPWHGSCNTYMSAEVVSASRIATPTASAHATTTALPKALRRLPTSSRAARTSSIPLAPPRRQPQWLDHPRSSAKRHADSSRRIPSAWVAVIPAWAIHSRSALRPSMSSASVTAPRAAAWRSIDLASHPGCCRMLRLSA